VTTAVRQSHPGGVDAVIHLAGDPTALLAALRPGGRFVSTMIGSPEQVPADDATVIAIYANPDAATLERVAINHVEGVTRVHVQDTYPLDQAPAASAAFAAGTLGKLVITTA
jgi:NADPH:quinone reductase-like Zn-dependent oxidoreductase